MPRAGERAEALDGEMDSKQYWNDKIVDWEDSVRDPGDVSAVERLAARFRRPLRVRSQRCLELLAPRVEGRHVVELGCGSGFFAMELHRRGSPSRIDGFDFANQAVDRARQRAADAGLADRLVFGRGDVVRDTFPAADITIGLGLLDYLSLSQIRALFDGLRSPQFLFTFAERTPTVLRQIHRVYMWSQRCPVHYYYSRAELAEALGQRWGELHFYSERGMSFGTIVHNMGGPMKTRAS